MTTRTVRVDTVLCGARLADGTVVDVRLSDGRIVDVESARRRPTGGDIDLRGYLLLTAPAEPHTHLDKAFTADCMPNATGDLHGAIAAWRQHRATLAGEDVFERAHHAAMAFLRNGATAIRSHVDVGAAMECRLLKPILALREQCRQLFDLQVVAMVNMPITGDEGRDNLAQLEQAVELGADVIGGTPFIDPHPIACQRLLLEIAAAAGLPADLHMDETLQPNVLTVASLAKERRRAGITHRVVASHCVSLGVQQPDVRQQVACALAAGDIAVVACPATNLYLQGRGGRAQPPRALTAIAELESADVLLAAGGDNIADPFYPLGRADPFETAALMVTAGQLTPERAYDTVSSQARRLMGLPPATLSRGSAAELLAIRASSVRDALANPFTDRMVFRHGQLVSSTVVEHAGRDCAPPVRPRNAGQSTAP